MKERLLTEKMIKEFEHYLVEDEKSGATIEKYLRDVAFFMKFSRGMEADKVMVMEYKRYLAANYAVASANSMLAALNCFFRSLGWTELCVKQFKVQQQIYCSREKELTKNEYFRLVEEAENQGKHRLALIIQTICSTGIRVGELPCITVEAVRRGEAVVRSKGKSRSVFIVSGLQKKLSAYARRMEITSGPIYVSPAGKPIDRSNIWRQMKQLCKSAGISESKVYPHNLRHLFARTFYENEKDVIRLADILGHTSINTTRIYTVSTGAEHRRKMEKMGLV